MAKKVSKFRMFEWKSLIWVSVVAVFTLTWLTFPEIKAYWRKKQVESFQGVTDAQILEVRDNKFLKQNQFGTEEKIISVTVRYQYNVKGTTYNRSQSFNPIDWYVPIRPLDSLGKPLPYQVKFDLDHPEKSILLTRN